MALAHDSLRPGQGESAIHDSPRLAEAHARTLRRGDEVQSWRVKAPVATHSPPACTNTFERDDPPRMVPSVPRSAWSDVPPTFPSFDPEGDDLVLQFACDGPRDGPPVRVPRRFAHGPCLGDPAPKEPPRAP
jgi:hypothetical protein